MLIKNEHSESYSVFLIGPNLPLCETLLETDEYSLKFSSENHEIKIPKRNIDFSYLCDNFKNSRYNQTVKNYRKFLTFYTKDLLIYEILFSTEFKAQKVYEIFRSIPKDLNPIAYAIDYRNKNPNLIYDYYRTENEFSDFHKIDINKDYETCSSYPCSIFYPKNISPDLLKESAKYRKNGRFPYLIYKNCSQNISLYITAQPNVKSMLNRSINNELKDYQCSNYNDASLFAEIIGQGNGGIIIDYSSITVKNTSLSKYQDTIDYDNWRKFNRPLKSVEEIHVALKNLVLSNLANVKLKKKSLKIFKNQTIKEKFPGIEYKKKQDEISKSTFVTQNFIPYFGQSSEESECPLPNRVACEISNHQNTDWFSCMKEYLVEAIQIARGLKAGINIDGKKITSVILIDSDGRDQVLVVSSLAKIILESKYRTIKGCSRNIFGASDKNEDFFENETLSVSPVFVLFLDCVWQITQQYPFFFQFNSQFLVKLFQHVYSSEFGDFLCNTEEQRDLFKINQKTYSVFAYLMETTQNQRFLNQFYNETESSKHPCFPSVYAQSFNLWTDLYHRQFLLASNKSKKMHDLELKLVGELSQNRNLVNELER